MRSYLFLWLVGLNFILFDGTSNAIDWQGQKIMRTAVYAVIRTVNSETFDKSQNLKFYSRNNETHNKDSRYSVLMRDSLSNSHSYARLKDIYKRGVLIPIAYCDSAQPTKNETENIKKLIRGIENISIIKSDLDWNEMQQTLSWCQNQSSILYKKLKSEDESKQKPTIYLIGDTQAGKTTTFHYLLNHPLTANNSSGSMLDARLVLRSTDKGKIGTSEKSITLAPNIDEFYGWTLCDLPGFIDNRSSTDAFKAAYVMKKCIEYGKERKFILVVSEPSFGTNAGEVIRKSVSMAKGILPNNINFEKHSLVLLTHSFFPLKTKDTDIGKNINQKPNGFLFNTWNQEKMFMHLPIPSPDTNDKNGNYEPKISGTAIRDHISSKIFYIESMPVSTDFQKRFIEHDFRVHLRKETAEDIETWCANYLLETFWKKKWKDVAIEFIVTEPGASRDKFMHACKNSVRQKMQKDKYIEMVSYVSPKISENALTQSCDVFLKALPQDDVFISIMTSELDHFKLVKNEQNTSAILDTGVVAGTVATGGTALALGTGAAFGAAGMSAAATTITTTVFGASAPAVIASAIGATGGTIVTTIAFPAICVGTVVGTSLAGLAWITGYWDPWATEEAKKTVQNKFDQ